MFRLISLMTYRTFSLEENGRVELKDGNLMMTKVTVTKLLQEWQVDNDILLQE